MHLPAGPAAAATSASPSHRSRWLSRCLSQGSASTRSQHRWQQARGTGSSHTLHRAPPGAAAATAVRSRLQLSSAAAQPGQASAVSSSSPAACSLPPAVDAFLSAFNERSVAGMASCLALQAEYVNLSHAQPYRGKQAVEAMLAALIAGAPADWRLAVLDSTCSSSAAAVVFCMQDGAGRAVPLSQGLAFYRLDEAGLIARITEASEQVFKLPEAALPAVGAAAHLLQALGSSPLASLLAGGQAAAASGQALARQQFMPGSSSGGSSGLSSSSSSFPSTSSSSASSSSNPLQLAGSSATLANARQAAVAAAAAAAPSSGPQPSSSPSSVPPGGSLAALSGTWVKDFAASDLEAYSRACDLLQLSGLQKTTALQLIEGVEIEQRGQQVAVRYLTVVPFFKVIEGYRLGSAVSMGRRDLRRGSQQATAGVGPGGSLQVTISWGAPNAGGVEEMYCLVGAGGDTLECVSTVTVAAGSATTRTVYRRSTSGWAPRYKWNPLFGIGSGGSGQ